MASLEKWDKAYFDHEFDEIVKSLKNIRQSAYFIIVILGFIIGQLFWK